MLSKNNVDTIDLYGVGRVNDKPQRIMVNYSWTIEVPVGYRYTVDTEYAAIGASGYPYLLQIQDLETSDFEKPYDSNVNLCVLGEYTVISHYTRDLTDLRSFVTSQMSIGRNPHFVKDTNEILLGSFEFMDSTFFLVFVSGTNILYKGQILFSDSVPSSKQKSIISGFLDSIEPITLDDLTQIDRPDGLDESFLSDFTGNEFVLDNLLSIPVPKDFSAWTKPYGAIEFAVVPDDFSVHTALPQYARISFAIHQSVTLPYAYSKEKCQSILSSLVERNQLGQLLSPESSFYITRSDENGIILFRLMASEDDLHHLNPVLIMTGNKLYSGLFALSYDDDIAGLYEVQWDVRRITALWLSQIQFLTSGKRNGVSRQTKNKSSASKSRPSSDSSASSENRKASITRAVPDKELYPHYDSLRSKGMNVPAGLTLLVNANGTEYQFFSLEAAVENDDLDEEKRSFFEKILDKDKEAYDLDEKAKELQKLFHVNPAAFNPGRDRECEIERGYLQKAYMMSALRSFAWTLADYCEQQHCSPQELDLETIRRIVSFIAASDWLNYDGKSFCKGLCSGSDLHVYFLPDGVSKADREKLLPSEETRENIRRMKERFPSYNEILTEVHSLDELRKDLQYIYPAVKLLWDGLEKNRNYDEALLGDEADIVYAWCSLALAAKSPFFSEDGPMNCRFTHLGGEQRPIPRKEAKNDAADEAAEWNRKYGKYVEANPVIVFEGSKFVFSGLAGHWAEKNHPTVTKVIEKGGLYRTTVSGVTDYLVVNPEYAGETKITAAIEQINNRKKIRVILLEDLNKALEGKVAPSPEPKESKPAKKAPQTRATKKETVAKSSAAAPFVFPEKKPAKQYITLLTKLIEQTNSTHIGLALKIDTFEKNRTKMQRKSESQKTYLLDRWKDKDLIYEARQLATVFRVDEDVFDPENDKENEIAHGILRDISMTYAYRSFAWTLKEYEKKNRILKGDYTREEISALLSFIESKKLANYSTAERTIGGLGTDEKNPSVGYLGSDFAALLQPMKVLYSILNESRDRKTDLCGTAADILATWCVLANTSLQSWLSFALLEKRRKYAWKRITDASLQRTAEILGPKPDENGFVIVNDTLVFYAGAAQSNGWKTDHPEYTAPSPTSLPEGIRVIGPRAFEGCDLPNLRTLPSTLVSIGEDAFTKCNLPALSALPENLQTIGRGAFYYCKELELKSLPGNLTKIPDFAFSGCEKLKLSSLPEGVVSIGRNAFSFCTSLEIEELPEKLKTIGEQAFGIYSFSSQADSQSLKRIHIPASVKTIEKNAFSNRPFSVEKDTFAHKWAMGNNSDITIVPSKEERRRIAEEEERARLKREEEEAKARKAREEAAARLRQEREKLVAMAAEKKARDIAEKQAEIAIVQSKIEALEAEKNEQQLVIQNNRGIFGKSARLRKAAKARVDEIIEKLVTLKTALTRLKNELARLQ